MDGALFAGAVFDPQKNGTWACSIADGGPVTTGGILCRWPALNPAPSPTPTRGMGGPEPTLPGVPTATRSAADDDSCAINPNSRGSSGGTLLSLFAAALFCARRRTR